MEFTRRKALVGALFGASYVGLRSLATGLPKNAFLGDSRAWAAGADSCAAPTKAQYIIMSTSGSGDPINANCPGTYIDPNITHNPDMTLMPKTAMTLGSVQTNAAKPWADLPQAVRDRMTFWHLMTNTPVHPKEPEVLKLYGTTTPNEMLPSLLAKNLAPCLDTLQTQPITVGAASPSEGLSFGGLALPIIPPLALKATLTAMPGPLTDLQKLRDDSLAKLDGIYRNQATKAQRDYLDSLVTSQAQVRNLNQDLLDTLSGITDNNIGSQITAAVALIQMKVAPVVVVHIPFGGDNHSDPGYTREAAECVSGCQAIADMMTALDAATLTDQVSFMSLNVFGRTLGLKPGTGGRDHNPAHQVSFTIGKPFAPGIIGGVTSIGSDWGCTGIDATTGGSGSDIGQTDTLASFGKTMMAAFGIDNGVIDASISSGKVVKAAIAS